MRQIGSKRNIRSLIGFELLLKGACLSFFLPVWGMVSDVCLWAAGYSYVTKENLAEFLLSPCMVLTAILFLMICLFLTLWEMNAVCLAVQEGVKGNRLIVSDLFFESIRETGKQFFRNKRGIKAAFCCMIFSIAVNVPLLVFVLSGLKRTESLFVNRFPLVMCFIALWGIVCVGGFVCSGKNSRLRRMIKRGILLYLAEGILYVTGLFCLIPGIIKTTDPAYSGVLFFRVFERYHILSCLLFATANTTVLAFLCIKLRTESGRFYDYGGVRREEGRGILRRKKYLRLAGALVLAITSVQTVSFFRNGTVLLSEALTDVCITAHRGASGDAPENTKASIAQAIGQGADYAEIDVRLTADGVPVLLHDAALFRTTGVLNDVDKVTYEEVSTYDAGIRYSREFAGEKVPCLREVLEEFGGDIGFNIELKTKKDKDLACSVVRLIEEYGLEDSCFVTAMSYEQLEWVKELNPGVKTGYILSVVYGDVSECEAADFFSVRANYVTEELIEQSHAEGKEVHAWTVNREKELQRMKAVGVDNIITDKPAYAREIVQKNKLADSFAEWVGVLTLKK